MKLLESVSNTINCLSSDEDVRQDLWVHYLSGTPVESLTARLDRIKVEYEDDFELQKSIWSLLQNPPSEQLHTLIETNFTDYERSIICCLMLGLSASKISNIKGISEVRVRQSISVIRYNRVWNEYKTLHNLQDKKDSR